MKRSACALYNGRPAMADEIADLPDAPRQKLPQARMYLKSARWVSIAYWSKCPRDMNTDFI